jgi:hypothetical protein
MDIERPGRGCRGSNVLRRAPGGFASRIFGGWSAELGEDAIQPLRRGNLSILPMLGSLRSVKTLFVTLFPG